MLSGFRFAMVFLPYSLHFVHLGGLGRALLRIHGLHPESPGVYTLHLSHLRVCVYMDDQWMVVVRF